MCGSPVVVDRAGALPARSMQVQDMLDPEYYVGAVRGADGAWTTAKYCDAAIDALVAERDMTVLCRVFITVTALPK